jgi:PAS domain S-box-containing protein
MNATNDFHARYATALKNYLDTRDEDSLAIGHELGRWALREQISMLEIIENHFTQIEELAKNPDSDRPSAVEFLLQTLAALDVVTRGYFDRTRRYEEQRARAEGLADRDKFRSALVNSLQEGFFVADQQGAIVEMNDAFVEIIGFPAEGMPYGWPHPWLVDTNAAAHQIARVLREGSAEYETPIQRQDGRNAWVTVSINSVRGSDTDPDAFVGTVRDITAQRAFAARENAVMRLATAVGVAKSLAEVLSITLEECRAAVDMQRVIAVIWPPGDGEPAIQAAGEPAVSTWRDLDPLLRKTFQDSRNQLPLAATTVEWPDMPGKARGMFAVLSGTGDVALWLELRAPRWVSAEDRLLVTVLVGHLSLAVQHVRQFEIARETSLTLQRAMLPPVQPPAGFTVRYEPAVPPLEIGGDWYDVLPVGDHRIGIVVGDCVGRGLPAAAIMGQLRSSARALLLTGDQPAVLLEQLDAAAALIPDAYCTTVFLAILDTESGILEYSNAGHMPAVLAEAGSRSGSGSGSGMTVLTGARSVPLAVRRNTPRPQTAQVLPSGSTLMLFTDGLVERRRESIDDGIRRAADVLAETMTLPLDAVAEAVLSALAPPAGYDDDVAMVIYRHRSAPLRIESDATADQLASIRHRLSGWLRGAEVPEELAADIVLVVNEACTNSIEHAYRDQDAGTMLLEVESVAGEVRVRVADNGSWEAPAVNPGNSGRGLVLIRAISDSVALDSTPTGTTVDVTFRLPTAAGVR